MGVYQFHHSGCNTIQMVPVYTMQKVLIHILMCYRCVLAYVNMHIHMPGWAGQGRGAEQYWT